MPLSQIDQATGLVWQTTGDPGSPPVVYLPGVQGDWSAQTQVRPLMASRFRFIETAYPRMANWSLIDYANALKELLDARGIESAHLIGESFGSLVAWQFAIENPQRVRSLTLLGGLTQPPRLRVAAAASAGLKRVPTKWFEAAIDRYVAQKNAAGQPRDSFALGAYPASRTSRGRLATANRMTIVQTTDLRHRLGEAAFPVRYLGGSRDLIVPVRRELVTLESLLPRECKFEGQLLPRATHLLIASQPTETVKRISQWIHQVQRTRTDPAGAP